MKIRFEKRAEPLEPVMALGRDHVARALFRRSQRYADHDEYRCLAAKDLFLITGPDLPWVDGVEYLGRSGNLYLPTTLQPIPEELFVDRIFRDYGSVAVLPDLTIINTVGGAELRSNHLEAWERILDGEEPEAT